MTNLLNTEKIIDLLVKNKFIINIIFLSWFAIFIIILLIILYFKVIKKRSIFGTNKDVKDGNVPFININKIKEAISF